MKLRHLCTVLLAVSLTGCVHNASAPVPGQINDFDATTYRTLSDSEAALDTVKADIANGTFTPSATQKAAFNDFIAAYNSLENAWQLYHAAAAGAPTQAQVQGLEDTLNAKSTVALSSGVPLTGGK